jgi:hypothetical protein
MTEGESFKEFFYSEDNPDRNALAAGNSYKLSVAAVSSVLNVANALGPNVSEDKKKEFIEDVCKTAQSETFIDKLSLELGKPKPGESENDFVRRAKAVMKETLRSRFQDR